MRAPQDFERAIRRADTWALGSVVTAVLSAVGLVLWFLFAGCAYQVPPVTFTGSYTSEDGVTVGGSVRLEPSFAEGKK